MANTLIRILFFLPIFWLQAFGCLNQRRPKLVKKPPVNITEWMYWGEWSACDATCNEAYKVRKRTCGSGVKCKTEGWGTQRKKCKVPICPGNEESWSQWTPCSRSCESGKKYRNRGCINKLLPCDQKRTESKTCKLMACEVDGGWTKWSTWTTCSRTCGEGYTISRRSCISPEPRNRGKDCEGPNFDYRTCILYRYCY